MKYKIPEGLSKEETHLWAKNLLENGKPEGDLRWLCRLIKVTEPTPVETAIDLGDNSKSFSVVGETIEQTKSNLTELFSKEEIRSAFRTIEESRESRNLGKLKDINLDDISD